MIKKILVSQPKPAGEKSPYYDLAKQFGVDVVFRPFIKVVGITEDDFRKQRTKILDYTAVIFTSRHSIDHFFNMANVLKIKIPATMRYFCVTEAIALYIQKYAQYRKRKIFFGTSGKLVDIVPLMVKHKSEKYLFPVSDVHGTADAALLEANELTFKECIMYRTVSNDFTKDEAFNYDLIVLFTPTGVSTLVKNFPDMAKRKVCIATFGPATAAQAKKLGLNLVIEAPTPQCPSMTSAIEQYLKKANSK